MKVRTLFDIDLINYKLDLFDCYQQNKLIFDNQNIWKEASPDGIVYFIKSFIDSPESNVLGIFDSQEMFLYGIIIFDNIRFGKGNKACAELHIVTNKALWGHKIKDIYKEMLKSVPFTTLFCNIPEIAVHAIRICKVLGFKKTGYIPECLPYINSKGEEILYDVQIWCYRR